MGTLLTRISGLEPRFLAVHTPLFLLELFSSFVLPIGHGSPGGAELYLFQVSESQKLPLFHWLHSLPSCLPSSLCQVSRPPSAKPSSQSPRSRAPIGAVLLARGG